MSDVAHPCLLSLVRAELFSKWIRGCLIIAVILTLFLVLCLPVFGQEDYNAVHIMTRVNARNSVPAGMTVSDPSLNTHTEPLRHAVELVLVPVSVTDPMGRSIIGLEKEHFEVYEGKQKQAVRNFSLEDAPISVGIILDMSRSMRDKFDKARQAVVQFMQTANADDEFFLVGFSDEADLLADFTSSIEEIQNKLIFAEPHGMTTLLDAIGMGMKEMQSAKYPRKALLIISDGGDNHSRYTEGEIKSVVEEGDVQLFAIGIFDADPVAREERDGPTLLSTLTNVTGGTTFFLEGPNELPEVAAKIGSQLRQQYVLAFAPANKRNDGKWHSIRVKLAPPKGLPKLTVHAKEGYYAHE